MNTSPNKNFNEIKMPMKDVVDSLDKKNAKYLVSYRLNQTTISKIKRLSNKYQMEESDFLEQVVSLLDAIISNKQEKKTNMKTKAEQIKDKAKKETEKETEKETKIATDKSDARARNISKTESNIMWSIAEPKKVANIFEEKKRTLQADVVDKPTINNKEPQIKNNQQKANREISPQELSSLPWSELQEQVERVIVEQFKPDYRVLYERFANKVKREIEIEDHVLKEVARKMALRGDLKWVDGEKLLDIKATIFERHNPGDIDLHSKYYEDDNKIIE